MPSSNNLLLIYLPLSANDEDNNYNDLYRAAIPNLDFDFN